MTEVATAALGGIEGALSIHLFIDYFITIVHEMELYDCCWKHAVFGTRLFGFGPPWLRTTALGGQAACQILTRRENRLNPSILAKQDPRALGRHV